MACNGDNVHRFVNECHVELSRRLDVDDSRPVGSSSKKMTTILQEKNLYNIIIFTRRDNSRKRDFIRRTFLSWNVRRRYSRWIYGHQRGTWFSCVRAVGLKGFRVHCQTSKSRTVEWFRFQLSVVICFFPPLSMLEVCCSWRRALLLAVPSDVSLSVVSAFHLKMFSQ